MIDPNYHWGQLPHEESATACSSVLKGIVQFLQMSLSAPKAFHMGFKGVNRFALKLQPALQTWRSHVLTVASCCSRLPDLS